MDFDEVIKKRKMVRKYRQERQIPTDLINKLLRNAHTISKIIISVPYRIKLIRFIYSRFSRLQGSSSCHVKDIK